METRGEREKGDFKESKNELKLVHNEPQHTARWNIMEQLGRCSSEIEAGTAEHSRPGLSCGQACFKGLPNKTSIVL